MIVQTGLKVEPESCSTTRTTCLRPPSTSQGHVHHDRRELFCELHESFYKQCHFGDCASCFGVIDVASLPVIEEQAVEFSSPSFSVEPETANLTRRRSLLRELWDGL